MSLFSLKLQMCCKELSTFSDSWLGFWPHPILLLSLSVLVWVGLQILEVVLSLCMFHVSFYIGICSNNLNYRVCICNGLTCPILCVLFFFHAFLKYLILSSVGLGIQLSELCDTIGNNMRRVLNAWQSILLLVCFEEVSTQLLLPYFPYFRKEGRLIMSYVCLSK